MCVCVCVCVCVITLTQVGDFPWSQLQALTWPGGQRPMLVREAIQMTSPHVECVTLDVKTYQDRYVPWHHQCSLPLMHGCMFCHPLLSRVLRLPVHGHRTDSRFLMHC